jgi:hypothetical protein
MSRQGQAARLWTRGWYVEFKARRFCSLTFCSLTFCSLTFCIVPSHAFAVACLLNVFQYVGLRLDGRVRASGRGCPPLDQFAAQLPPTDGFFGGFLDGMDGRVGGG